MLTIRRLRYGLVTLVVLAIAWVVWQARGALVPFVVGGILAYVLSPLVERLARSYPFYRRRPELARTLAIVSVYIVGFALLVTAGAAVIPAIVTEGQNLVDDAPRYVEQARTRIDEWNALYRECVPLAAQERIDQYLERLGQTAGAFAQNALNRTFTVTQGVVSIVLGYVVIPFWLFYILKDRHKIGPAIQTWFPPGLRRDVDQCIDICRRVLGSYIRAQLALGLFIGVITTISLLVLRVQFAVVLGIVAGISELIPILGPILGAIPALVVVLATDPGKTFWVLLLYVAIQQVENAVLVPRVQGNAVKLHPAMIIVLLVIAQQLAGFLGMVVVVPLAAVSRDLFAFIYRRLREREEEIERVRRAGLMLPSGEPVEAHDSATAAD